jgi:multimeric flavodoxin WrbA
MYIIMLHGGARKKGNTATAAGWVEEELSAQGHTIESIYLFDKNIKGCLACAKCKDTPDKVACVQKDDAVEILDRMVASDLVIFTSPLYFWGLAGPLKTFIDRTYSLYVDYHKPTHVSLVEGQRQALLVTGGGPYENNAEAVFFAFNRLQAPHKAVKAGEIYLGKCTSPEKIDAATKERVLAFAREIVS